MSIPYYRKKEDLTNVHNNLTPPNPVILFQKKNQQNSDFISPVIR